MFETNSASLPAPGPAIDPLRRCASDRQTQSRLLLQESPARVAPGNPAASPRSASRPPFADPPALARNFPGVALRPGEIGVQVSDAQAAQPELRLPIECRIHHR